MAEPSRHVVQFDVHICSSGDGTVIHPRVTIIAETGPIVIGKNNLIEEAVTIINKYDGSVLLLSPAGVYLILVRHDQKPRREGPTDRG